MAKATKLPSGNWRCVVYVRTDENGKRIRRSFTAPTKKEAERLAAEFNAYKRRESTSGTKSIEMILEEYIQSKSNVLSPSTIRGYRSIQKGLPKSFLRLPEKAIETREIQEAINQYAVNRKPKSVENAVILLVSALKQADVQIDRNRLSLPQRKAKEIQIFTEEEVRKLLNVYRDTVWECPIMLAAYAGMRRGEIAALRWDDIDFQSGKMHIRRSVAFGEDHIWHSKAPKSVSGDRIIDMPSVVQEMLKRQPKTSKFVCRLAPNTLTTQFPLRATQAGVPAHNFHSLRHYCASLFLSLNVPNKYTQNYLGHSTDHMLKTVYQHIMADKKDEVSAAIDSYLSQSR